MIVSVVRGLDQEWYKAILHLLYDVRERISEWATSINAALSLEIDSVDSTINVSVPEIVQVRGVSLRFHALDDLTIDTVFALMVNLTFLGEDHSFAPVYTHFSLPAIGNRL